MLFSLFKVGHPMNKLCLTLSLVFSLHLVALSQGDSARLITIAAKLQKLSATRPTEKVYLHFNKPGYNTGDTIWFKGYLTICEHHQPSALSGILYVDLIDGKDKIIKSLQLKAVNGISTGDIAISNKLPTGDYRIRAYTNWMRNSSPDYFFNKTISIGNIKTSAVFVNSSYVVSNKNYERSVKTKLAYTDKFGRPHDHKEVSYEVRADTNLLYKGKGITDDKGNISFTFPGKTIPGQRVKIINHIKLIADITIDKTIPLNLQNDNIDLQFFPEGGQLVNDVRSKVAFKAIGINGLGTPVKGVVLDNDNKEVAYFEAQHAGMGIFALTPQSGKTYTAKIILADSTTLTVNLPQVIEKGLVLAVNSIDSLNLGVRIATNALTLQEQPNSTFYLVGQSAGKVYYTTFGRLDNSSCLAIIPKNKFPTGIAQFTLFSSTGEPLNERVVFIQNTTDQLNLNLKTEKPVYAQREKVSMALSAKDAANKPVMGSFSVTVFNEDRLTANESAESTILSNILLTSDLRGYIEEPNYYFNDPTDKTKADLDVLLLTQGYRRFEWKDILENHYPPLAYEAEKSLSISGQLTTMAGKPVVKGRLKVLALANKTVVDTITDEQGRFNLTDVDIPDSAKLVIEARKANDGKNVNISLDNDRTIPIIFKSNIGDATDGLALPFLRMAITGVADTNQLAANIKANTIITGKALNQVNIKAKPAVIPDKYNKYGTVEVYNLNMAQARDYNWVDEAIKWKVPFATSISKVIVNNLEFPRSYLGLLDPQDIESIVIDGGTTAIITTKSYAGTDTVKVNNSNTVISNTGKILKDVNIKAKTRVIDQPRYASYPLEEYDFDMAKVKDYNWIYDYLTIRFPGFEGYGWVFVDDLKWDDLQKFDPLKTLNIDDIESVSYVISYVPKLFPNMVFVTTKAHAGTDTVKLKNANNAALNKGKTLKDVNIKAQISDKADQSNLWGSIKPSAVITGQKLQDYPTIRSAIVTAAPWLRIGANGIVDPIHGGVHIVLNNFEVTNGQMELLNADVIDNIKIIDGAAIKAHYGITPTSLAPLIVITTKQFAGTDTAPVGDTIKVNALAKGGKNLKEVTIKDKKLTGNENPPWMPVVTRSANLNGPGHANQIFGIKELENCFDFLGCVMNKIPGVKRPASPGGEYYFFRHTAQSITHTPAIKFMLDGMFDVKPADLQYLNVGDVETVEVLNSSSYLNIYGSEASGGLIIITTKIGNAPANDAIAFKSVPGVIYTKFNGFYKAKEFYVPKYTAAYITSPDYRTAIYWNPNIVTDSNGTFPIEYFNSDVKGAYRAVVEGIDNDGNIGRYVYRYKVE